MLPRVFVSALCCVGFAGRILAVPVEPKGLVADVNDVFDSLMDDFLTPDLTPMMTPILDAEGFRYLILFNATTTKEQINSMMEEFPILKEAKHFLFENPEKDPLRKVEGLIVSMAENIAEVLKKNPFVQHIELAQHVVENDPPQHVSSTADFTFKTYSLPESRTASSNPCTMVQEDAPWHLARLSRNTSMNSRRQTGPYYYPPNAGKGVDVYVVDSGVDISNPLFEGCAVKGVDVTNGNHEDTTGHGTHVAGLICSPMFGTAKSSRVISVKVFDGPMTSGGYILAGLEWAYNNIKKTKRPSIINLSLGTEGRSAIMDAAVRFLVQNNVPVVVAAGNEDANACYVSPAAARGPLSVGSTDYDDSRSSFSNWGKCVDVFAPGGAITSLAPNNRTAVQSGTSMSAPIVSGLAAIMLGLNNSYVPRDLFTNLLAHAQNGIVTGARTAYGSPDDLVQNVCFK
eukprot:comp12496_c0_seq1/m.7448 comp12496_c0_seq1/g.7448  ORF comp12496_c0_seq1/g.7448 comp12496_c0_seq1/m.7448 type:complete len:457 (-) comp12496_c0_seq1:319-1689(-)